MTDIVERLRDLGLVHPTAREAADEIERLRAHIDVCVQSAAVDHAENARLTRERDEARAELDVANRALEHQTRGLAETARERDLWHMRAQQAAIGSGYSM